MKKILKDLKSSVNWKTYIIYTLFFNALLLFSDWNLESFLILNALFILIALGAYINRKIEIKKIEGKSDDIYNDLNKELNYYDLNMLHLNNEKRKGNIGIDEYENLIKLERNKLIKTYINILNKNI